jgi:hypothetical protein
MIIDIQVRSRTVIALNIGGGTWQRQSRTHRGKSAWCAQECTSSWSEASGAAAVANNGRCVRSPPDS